MNYKTSFSWEGTIGTPAISASGIPEPNLIIQDGPHRLTSTSASPFGSLSGESLPWQPMAMVPGSVALTGEAIIGGSALDLNSVQFPICGNTEL